jgi:membrane protease YdiL (CAAX protease family)
MSAASTWGARFRSLLPHYFFLESWRQIDAEAAAERASRTSYDYRPLIALAVGAVCLTLMEYAGHSGGVPNAIYSFREFLDTMDPPFGTVPPDAFWARLRISPWLELADFAWWSGWRVFGYFVVPALVIKFVFKERIRDHGLETKGFLEHAWIYGLAYLVVFVCVVLVARYDEHFRTYYPFYSRASRSWADFIGWELLYAAQFFSLEFFFRGFWLKSMKSALGSHAIFAMVVPYCMIHFGKPFLECLAAILAGVFLGTLSMKTRSIWSGFLIHVSVAVSMDVAALLATGRGVPASFWPG